MTIPILLFIFWNKCFTKIKLFFRSHVCEIFLVFFFFLLSFDLGYSVLYWLLYDFIIFSMAFFNFNCFNRKFYMINTAIRTSSNTIFSTTNRRAKTCVIFMFKPYDESYTTNRMRLIAWCKRAFRFLWYDDMMIFTKRSEIPITAINNIYYVSCLKMTAIFKFFM